jgi:hypothetical protein
MLREARDEQTFWEQMASEAEAAKVALEQRLADRQVETVAQPREAVSAFVAVANTAAAAVHLDEAETRKLIDQQLRLAGWIADSATLVYALGRTLAEPVPVGNVWATHLCAGLQIRRGVGHNARQTPPARRVCRRAWRVPS